MGRGITPHLNLGYEHNFGATDQSAVEYVLGFDWGTDRYSLAAELVGSHELDGDGIGDDIVDTAWGAKWNPWGQVLLAYNLRLPLNDAGLRPAAVSTLSVEYDF